MLFFWVLVFNADFLLLLHILNQYFFLILNISSLFTRHALSSKQEFSSYSFLYTFCPFTKWSHSVTVHDCVLLIWSNFIITSVWTFWLPKLERLWCTLKFLWTKHQWVQATVHSCQNPGHIIRRLSLHNSVALFRVVFFLIPLPLFVPRSEAGSTVQI